MISMDEICIIIGAKELELFQVRKELAETRAVLERVTSGEQDGQAAADDLEAATDQPSDDGDVV